VSADRLAALVATELLRASAEAIDQTIGRAFAQVGEHRDVLRAYYYRLDEDAGSFELSHEWHRAELRPLAAVPRLTRLPIDVLPASLMAALRAGHAVPLPRTLGQIGGSGGLVSPDGDRAIVFVPALLNGALLGVAGFAAPCEATWAPADVEMLEIVAQGVARAVERRRVDEALRVKREEAEAARAEVAAILCRISDAFVAFDRQGRCRYVNEPAVVMLGQSRDALVGRAPWDVMPVLAGAFRAAFQRALVEQQAVTLELPGIDGRRTYEARLYPSPTGVSVFAEDISDRKRREEELIDAREYLREEVGGLDAGPTIVGFDEGLSQVLARVDSVAAGTTTVLITGETGTGKELVARAIHERSPRRDRLLVKVNCAAISSGLVESELFGHEKGAFTGALARRKGRFELAHGGTLFLDEVGELPLDLQAKLLRVLQERELERVGGTETVKVDVRVIAATNRDLADMVARGKFREDLYYRLDVFPIALPPLRERPRDVALLVHSFLRRFSRQAGKRIGQVTPEAMRRLEAYRWPGNVRELQNVIERAVILAQGPTLGLEALPSLEPREERTVSVVAAPLEPAAPTVAQVEREYVTRTLAATEWVIEGEHGAARRLGLHPNTLRSRLKRWGIRRPEAGDVHLSAVS
jgi:PAS domain S-box-containing protein